MVGGDILCYQKKKSSTPSSSSSSSCTRWGERESLLAAKNGLHSNLFGSVFQLQMKRIFIPLTIARLRIWCLFWANGTRDDQPETLDWSCQRIPLQKSASLRCCQKCQEQAHLGAPIRKLPASVLRPEWNGLQQREEMLLLLLLQCRRRAGC